MNTWEYTTASERKDFCNNCCEICSRHCAIYRKAEERRDADDRQREVHGSCQALRQENL